MAVHKPAYKKTSYFWENIVIAIMLILAAVLVASF
jgi:hypothetical protein